jgi:hypothetical protein
MVWKNGMGAWAAASSVQNLFPNPPAVSSPPPGPVPGSPPETPKGKAEGSAGYFNGLKETVGKLTEIVKSVREGHSWVVKVVPGLAVALPLIGDFLRPIAPFNFLIFVISSLVALSLVVLFVKRPRMLNVALGGTCALFVVMALGFGFWWGLAWVTGSKHKGLLAEHVPLVERMQASVIRGASVVTEQQVEGDKLAEEVGKHMEQEKDARELLQYAFDGYPGNVIKAEVIGDPKRKPGAEGVYQYDLQISVDVEQYETITKNRILPVLEKVALRKGEEFASARKTDHDGSTAELRHKNRSSIEDHIVFGREAEFRNIRELSIIREGKCEVDEMIVWVNTARSGSDDRTTWKWYVVPKAPVFDRRAITVDVIFQDKKQQELLRERIQGKGRDFQGLPGLCWYTWGGGRAATTTKVIMSAYLLGVSNVGETTRYVPSLTLKKDIKLTPAELAKLGSIRCSVKNSGGGG